MATFGGVETASSTASTNTITVTKPSGLAEGNLMIVVLHQNDWSDGTQNIPAQTGWTQLHETQFPQGDLENTIQVSYKVASSSDAAASNFTFDLYSGDRVQTATLMYFTGQFDGAANILDSDTDADSGTSYTYPGGVTPGVALSTLVFIVNTASGSGGMLISDYAVSNNDPSWTTRTGIAENDGTRWIRTSFATASYTADTTTGDYTASSSVTSDSIGTLIAIYENTDVTINPGVADINVSAPASTEIVDYTHQPTAADVDMTPPAINASVDTPLWDNENKPADSTFTNVDKP